MPATGNRAAASAGQTTRRSSRAPSSSSDQTAFKKPEKAKSTQSYAQARRESSAAVAGTTALPRPPTKGRAYSAPMIPKTHHHAAEHDDDLDQSLGGEPADTDEIASDPFFQRYNFANDNEQGHPANAAMQRDSSSDTEGPMSPTTHVKPKQLVLEDPMPSPVPRSPLPGSELNTMQEINIGVLGAAAVGKTTFVQRILELKTRPTSAFSARKMAIDGTIYLIRLVEIAFDDIDIGDDEGITWPDTIDDLATPRIDGAFAMYDVMSSETLTQVPEMLNAIQKASIPFALVSWKCDNHPAHRQVDPVSVEERARGFLGEILTYQSSEAAQDMQKRCLSVMLRAIVAIKNDRPMAANARRRANSTAVRQEPQRQQWSKGHERASSEYSSSRIKLDNENRYSGKRKSAQRIQGGTPQQSFLDLEESPGYDSADSDDQTSDGDHYSVMTDIPSDEKGYTFDQLVNRLLAQPLSKSDSKFSAVFLALYRLFAAPGQLLDAIISRFKGLSKDRKPALMRVTSQLRYLAILEQWIRWYPGDFAQSSTRRKMRHFVTRLQGNRIFAVAAREMICDLDVVGDDDDTDWACCDKAREKADPSKAYPPIGSVLDEDSEEDYSKLIGSISLAGGEKGFISPGTTRSTSLSITGSTASSQAMLNGVESAQRQAKMLGPTGKLGLSKMQWHTLFIIDDDHIARELTRIDWIMFSSIRPRDLVRDVTLNADQKKLCKSLENVNRMTEHFNHLSHWVTNFILLRDKPKHRALMLAKFMKVARKVRELNNYNALGAILAGINNTAVHRLASTKDQVPHDVGKDFMKLEILMGTQKSHFAYRLAWDNSSGERIPYLPLLRRDLVSAAQGNSTFVGDRKSQDSLSNVHPGTAVFTGRAENREAPAYGVSTRERINWRKFEIMGEVIVGVQRAQGTPYPPLSKNDDVKCLLLDVRLVQDDEDLYNRSVSLEAPANSGDRRRFNWFSK